MFEQPFLEMTERPIHFRLYLEDACIVFWVQLFKILHGFFSYFIITDIVWTLLQDIVTLHIS
jgi:hypothetical protein